MGRSCGSCRLSLKDVVVCLSGCAAYSCIFIMIMGLNTLFNDWQNSFGSDRGSTASVQAVCLGCTTGAGLIAGVVERKLGPRMTLLLGSFLSAAGCFAGGFADSLPVLIVTVGAVSGCGCSLVFLASTSSTLQRFPRRANFASSVLVMSSGISSLVSPFCFRYFTETYSWRGCLILISALSSHASIFSLLLTSPLLQTPKVPERTSASLSPETGAEDSTDQKVQKTCPDPAPQTEGDFCEETDCFGDVAKGDRLYDLDLPSESPLLDDGVTKAKILYNLESALEAGEGVAKEGKLGERNPHRESPFISDVTAKENTTRNMNLSSESPLLGDSIPKDGTGQNLEISKESPSSAENVMKDTITIRLDPMTESTYSHDEAAEESSLIASDTLDPESARYSNPSNAHSSTVKARNRSVDEPVDGHRPDVTIKANDENFDICQESSEACLSEAKIDSPENRATNEQNRRQSQTADEAAFRAEEGHSGTAGGGTGRWLAQVQFAANPLYITTVVSSALALASVMCFVFLVLDYASYHGWSQDDGLSLNVVFLLSSIVGRGLILVMSLNRKVNSIIVVCVAGTVGSLCVCVLGQVTDYVLVSCLYVGLSVCFVGTISMYPPSVMQAVGSRDLPLALGLCMSVMGTTIIGCTRLAGFLVDSQGSYSLVSYVYGFSTLFADVLLLFTFVRRKTSRTTEKR